MLERVSVAVARHGHSIILGRGAYIVLGGLPRVLNVRLLAPFLSSVYGVRWDSIERFDLVVDTSRIGIERAASWIAEAAKQLPEELPDAQIGKPDPVLDEAIADELGCKVSAR
jgi:hypothetical protein